MNKLVSGAVAITLAAAGTGLTATAANAANAANAKIHGCPSGAVCIYPPGKGFNKDNPSIFFYSYGAHNLSNVTGRRVILNNQNLKGCSGDRPAWLYDDYNGRGDLVYAVNAWDFGADPDPTLDFGPIDSVVLKNCDR